METRETKIHQFTECECPCCGGCEWEHANQLPAFIFGVSAEIIVCHSCGCGATWPSPSLRENYYQENQGYSELFTQNAALYNIFAKGLLKSLDGIIDPLGKTMLDIGCGGGFLVQAATDIGMIAEGVEANAEMVGWGKSRGLNVSQLSVEQLKVSGKRFDVIVLSAILEHLKNPHDLLLSCKDILRDGGVVLVSQASFDGLLPRLFAWGWYGWQPQEHFWHFTPKSFNKLAEKSGYRTQKLVRGSLYHQWFGKGGIKVLLGRNTATLLAKLGAMLNRGDSFNAVLKVSC